MSHDARWFMAVANECGIEVANKLNKVAARGVGKVEAQRIGRALSLSPSKTVDEWMLTQEVIISLLGPDLLEYRVIKNDDSDYQIEVQRCFAYENASRAGIADCYECGIFARITGWLEAFGLAYELRPSLGKCLKAEGQECVYRISLGKGSPA
jgi:hypothetical protein